MRSWHYSPLSMTSFPDDVVFSSSTTSSLVNIAGSFGFAEFFLWNLRMASFEFSKSKVDYHDEFAFHSSYDSTYVTLYSVFPFDFRQSITFRNSHFSCDLFSPDVSIRIGGCGNNIWPEKAFDDVRCNFHEWNIEINPTFFKCWEISNS